MNAANIARQAIRNIFYEKKSELSQVTKNKFGKIGASFVTLSKNGELRGCIGSLISTKPLWQDIEDNAINAAFHDSRFPRLRKEELDDIKIEVSILSKPREIIFENEEELLKKINSNMGIILNYQGYTSTFLPQVWEDIPNKLDFLEKLSLKAGLKKNIWKKAKIFYYKVEKIRE